MPRSRSVVPIGWALLLADGDWAHFAMSAAGGVCEGVPEAARGGFAGFGAAMLGAMWAYNGWNEVTYVGGEVKDPHRNLPLAIIGGIGIIATLYVFANVAYFYVLAPAAVPASGARPCDELVTRFSWVACVCDGSRPALRSSIAAGRVSRLCADPYAMAVDGLFFRARAPALARGCRFARRCPGPVGRWCLVFYRCTNVSRTTRSLVLIFSAGHGLGVRVSGGCRCALAVRPWLSVAHLSFWWPAGCYQQL